MKWLVIWGRSVRSGQEITDLINKQTEPFHIKITLQIHPPFHVVGEVLLDID